jgi:hypothetical protein
MSPNPYFRSVLPYLRYFGLYEAGETSSLRIASSGEHAPNPRQRMLSTQNLIDEWIGGTWFVRPGRPGLSLADCTEYP